MGLHARRLGPTSLAHYFWSMLGKRLPDLNRSSRNGECARAGSATAPPPQRAGGHLVRDTPMEMVKPCANSLKLSCDQGAASWPSAGACTHGICSVSPPPDSDTCRTKEQSQVTKRAFTQESNPNPHVVPFTCPAACIMQVASHLVNYFQAFRFVAWPLQAARAGFFININHGRTVIRDGYRRICRTWRCSPHWR